MNTKYSVVICFCILVIFVLFISTNKGVDRETMNAVCHSKGKRGVIYYTNQGEEYYECEEVKDYE